MGKAKKRKAKQATKEAVSEQLHHEKKGNQKTETRKKKKEKTKQPNPNTVVTRTVIFSSIVAVLIAMAVVLWMTPAQKPLTHVPHFRVVTEDDEINFAQKQEVHVSSEVITPSLENDDEKEAIVTEKREHSLSFKDNEDNDSIEDQAQDSMEGKDKVKEIRTRQQPLNETSTIAETTTSSTLEASISKGNLKINTSLNDDGGTRSERTYGKESSMSKEVVHESNNFDDVDLDDAKALTNSESDFAENIKESKKINVQDLEDKSENLKQGQIKVNCFETESNPEKSDFEVNGDEDHEHEQERLYKEEDEAYNHPSSELQARDEEESEDTNVEDETEELMENSEAHIDNDVSYEPREFLEDSEKNVNGDISYKPEGILENSEEAFDGNIPHEPEDILEDSEESLDKEAEEFLKNLDKNLEDDVSHDPEKLQEDSKENVDDDVSHDSEELQDSEENVNDDVSHDPEELPEDSEENVDDDVSHDPEELPEDSEENVDDDVSHELEEFLEDSEENVDDDVSHDPEEFLKDSEENVDDDVSHELEEFLEDSEENVDSDFSHEPEMSSASAAERTDVSINTENKSTTDNDQKIQNSFSISSLGGETTAFDLVEDEDEDSSVNDEPRSYHVEEKRTKIIENFKYSPISDGVKKYILRDGYGDLPRKGDTVTLHCVGYIDKNPPKMFWNTKELGQRMFSFSIGEKQVIKGWDQAAASMKLRERSKFKIEAKKAYGKFGFKAWDIPPNADLIMEFEIISIKRSKKRSMTTDKY